MKTFYIKITTTDEADAEAVDEALTRGLDDAIRECDAIRDYEWNGPPNDQLIERAVDNANWLLSEEAGNDKCDFHEVAFGLAEQVREILAPASREKPAATTDAERVEAALALLREARDLLKAAGAPKVTARVRLAITSCKGAVEHARSRPYRIADGRTKRIKRAPKVEIARAGRDGATVKFFE